MEQQLRSLGGVLQLGGVGVVAWELHLAIAKYPEPSEHPEPRAN